MARWKEQEILVVDLEASCWEDKQPPNGEQNEIIEIGVSTYNFKTCEIGEADSFLIKPTLSKISPFCTQLTTITQELLDTEGKDWQEQLNAFIVKYSPMTKIWASYGEYDKIMFAKQSTKMSTFNPFQNSIHFNVKTLFSVKMGMNKEVGMEKALNLAKIPLEGTHHRGGDDAKNTAKLLKFIFKN